MMLVSAKIIDQVVLWYIKGKICFVSYMVILQFSCRLWLTLTHVSVCHTAALCSLTAERMGWSLLVIQGMLCVLGHIVLDGLLIPLQ